MSDQDSSGGAKQDFEESTITPSLSAVDMLALGFGMIDVSPLEDKTKQIKVSNWHDGSLKGILDDNDKYCL